MDPVTLAMISAIITGILRFAVTMKSLMDNKDPAARDRMLQQANTEIQAVLGELNVAAASAEQRLAALERGENPY
jgi:hypothetical protein